MKLTAQKELYKRCTAKASREQKTQHSLNSKSK